MSHYSKKNKPRNSVASVMTTKYSTMDDFIQMLGKKKPLVLSYFREGTIGMPTTDETPLPEHEATGGPRKSPPHKLTQAGRGRFSTSLIRSRDTIISVIRSNYKTSIYSLTIDHFSTILLQKQFSQISPAFLFYKYCHCFGMLASLGWSIAHVHPQSNDIAWHLFLEHWMSVVGSAEALCGVFTVTYFYHHCRTKAMRDSYHISEGLYVRLMLYAVINTTAITFVCSCAMIFWFFIYGKCSSTGISIEHIVLPALLIVKMNVENIPFTVDRISYPVTLLLIYFINLIVHYYIDYRSLFNAGEPKQYIFIYFNDESLLHFLWFMLESLLLTIAVHIFVTLMWHSRWLFVRLCCPKRLRLSRELFDHQGSPELRNKYVREDYVEATPDPRKTAWKRCLERITDLERAYRHDFIQPEWKRKLRSRPPLVYVFYRTGHMTLHCLMLFISLFEPEKSSKTRTVKYFILWGFYFGNFFLCVSFIQSLMGFAVIVMAYSRKTSLKYYEKSELHVTGFQRVYAATNSCAVAVAVFTFVSSWVLVDDTRKQFASHDYSYDIPHLVNPMSMCLDFVIVGHSYRFINFIMSFGILGMNVVFNFWLYSSKITGRSGAKFIYDYLNWDSSRIVMIHILVLFTMLAAVHVTLWAAFLVKRTLNVGFQRRHLYRPRQQIFRDDSNDFLKPNVKNKPPLIAEDLSVSQNQETESELPVGRRSTNTINSVTAKTNESPKTTNLDFENTPVENPKTTTLSSPGTSP